MARTCLKCRAPLAPHSSGEFCPACVFEHILSRGTLSDAIAAGGIGGSNRVESEVPPRASANHRKTVLRFGDYELCEEIASGGMGVVFRARQITLNRWVALKMIRSGHLASEPEIQRFHSEAEAVASLAHPHIVSIHEVGELDGQHFFSMELIEGKTLARLIQDYTKDLRSAARLMVKVGRAVHYAHQRGILHRDLKPSNLLIDGAGEPHLADFGLAKRLEEDSELTVSGAVLGTPNYMSPEQAQGKGSELTTASDVYSLGAILYHLLTGRPPFRAETAVKTLRSVVEDDAERPSVFQRHIDRDLETICLKCLEKQPALRYRCAEALADDLERWLDGEPIEARRASAWERAVKWSRRKPASAALAAFSGVAAVLFVTLILVNRADLKRERDYARLQADIAEREKTQTKATLVELELERAEAMQNSGDVAAMLSYLAHVLRQDATNRIAAEWLVHALNHHNLPLALVPPLEHQDRIVCARFSPDGTKILTASWDRSARIWDARTGRALAAPLMHDWKLRDAEFSPDGRFVVTASDDRTAMVWVTETGRRALPPFQHDGPVNVATFSPDGTRIVTASEDRTCRIWDAITGRQLTEPLRHAGPVNTVEFSPTGLWLLTGSGHLDETPQSSLPHGGAQIWDAITGESIVGPLDHPAPVSIARFSPDGDRFFTVSLDQQIRIWDAQSGRRLSASIRPGGIIHAASFNPDGFAIIAALDSQKALLWNGFTGFRLGRELMHRGEVTFARFSPTRRMIVTTSTDHSARLWAVRGYKLITDLIRHQSRVRYADFSPDARTLVTASDEGVALIHDIRPSVVLPQVFKHEGKMWCANFSPDGHKLATASADHSARIWGIQEGGALTPPLLHEGEVYQSIFSSDGNRLLTCSDDGTARLWKIEAGQIAEHVLPHPKALRSAMFNRDDSKILTVSMDGVARLWDMRADGTPKESLASSIAHDGYVADARFSADGRWIATGSTEGTVRVWNAETCATAGPPFQQKAGIETVRFSPDGAQIAILDTEGTARLFDWRTGELLVSEFRHTAEVLDVEFSPRGFTIATASKDHTVRIWDSRTGQLMTQPLQHAGEVTLARFSPDGERVVSVSNGTDVQLWDARSGHPLSSLFAHLSPVTDVRFSSDGMRVVTTAENGMAMVWDTPKVPVPVPSWLPDLAEAFGGLKLNPDRTVSAVPAMRLIELRDFLLHLDKNDFFGRWGSWLVSDRTERTLSPWLAETVLEHISRLIEENTMQSLQLASWLDPGHPEARSRLEKLLSETGNNGWRPRGGRPEGAP